MSSSELLDLLTDKQRKAKERQQERSKQCYERNKDKIKERTKKNYQENREECIARVNRYNHEHREEVRQYAKDYYQRTKAKREAEAKDKGEEKPQQEKKVPASTFCEVCQVNVSKSNRFAHPISNKHLKKLKEQQERDQQEVTN